MLFLPPHQKWPKLFDIQIYDLTTMENWYIHISAQTKEQSHPWFTVEQTAFVHGGNVAVGMFFYVTLETAGQLSRRTVSIPLASNTGSFWSRLSYM